MPRIRMSINTTGSVKEAEDLLNVIKETLKYKHIYLSTSAVDVVPQ